VIRVVELFFGGGGVSILFLSWVVWGVGLG
jgi:hypothetical protein